MLAHLTNVEQAACVAVIVSLVGLFAAWYGGDWPAGKSRPRGTKKRHSVLVLVVATSVAAAASVWIGAKAGTPDAAYKRVSVVLDAKTPLRATVAGIPVSGTLCGDVADQPLWVFVYAPDKTWYLDDRIPPTQGHFSLPSGALGRKVDKNQTFLVEVVAPDQLQSLIIDQKLSERRGQPDVPFDVVPGNVEATLKIDRT